MMESQVNESFLDFRDSNAPFWITVEHIECSFELKNLISWKIIWNIVIGVELFGFGRCLRLDSGGLWCSTFHKIFKLIKIKTSFLIFCLSDWWLMKKLFNKISIHPTHMVFSIFFSFPSFYKILLFYKLHLRCYLFKENDSSSLFFFLKGWFFSIASKFFGNQFVRG